MGKKQRNKQVLPEQELVSSLPVEVREEVKAEEAPAAPKLDFDAWYALRKARIPKHHHKEILKADFKARGLGQQGSLMDFDAALEKYGVKLN